MTDEQKLALSVSNSAGYIATIEHTNTIREVCGSPRLTEEQYQAGILACSKLGRSRVIALHREAIDKIASQFPP